MGIEVVGPKPLETHPGDEIIRWAREQLDIARSILDNPGGGLLFATQTIGQVGAALNERDSSRWEAVVRLLEQAEDAAVHREFADASRQLDDAVARLA